MNSLQLLHLWFYNDMHSGATVPPGCWQPMTGHERNGTTGPFQPDVKLNQQADFALRFSISTGNLEQDCSAFWDLLMLPSRPSPSPHYTCIMVWIPSCLLFLLPPLSFKEVSSNRSFVHQVWYFIICGYRYLPVLLLHFKKSYFTRKYHYDIK